MISSFLYLWHIFWADSQVSYSVPIRAQSSIQHPQITLTATHLTTLHRQETVENSKIT